MRLIDADKLIKDMRNKWDMQDLYLPIHFKELLIDEQPTAFDVEQLEEFKEYKKNKHRSLRYMYEKGYNKAIDDLTEKIAIYGTYDDYGNVVHVLEIAEKLKKEC